MFSIFNKITGATIAQNCFPFNLSITMALRTGLFFLLEITTSKVIVTIEVDAILGEEATRRIRASQPKRRTSSMV